MEITPLEQRIQTVCLLILTTVAIAAGLWWLRPVMIPFVLAIFISLGLSPLIDLQIERLRFPRPLAVLVTMVLGFVLLTLLGALLSTSVAQLVANAGEYQEQIEQLLNRAAENLRLERFGIEDPPRALRIPFATVGRTLVDTANAIINILSRGVLVLIFMFFLLAGGTARNQPIGGIWGEVQNRIKRYVVFKTLLSAVTGALVGSVLSLLGVDLALVFGLFAFLLNFIPSLGSIIATLLPLPVVLVSPDISSTEAVLAIALPGLVQIFIGNFAEPKIMGEGLDLHPVTILMSLVVWGMLWGIVGMLLAVPITAVMKMFFERMEITLPVAELFAGRIGASDHA